MVYGILYAMVQTIFHFARALSLCPFLNNYFFSLIYFASHILLLRNVCNFRWNTRSTAESKLYVYICVLYIKTMDDIEVDIFSKNHFRQNIVPYTNFRVQFANTHTLHVQTGLHYAIEIHFISEMRIHSISPNAN